MPVTVREYFEGMSQYDYDVLAHRVRLSVWRFVGWDNTADILHDVVASRGDYPLMTSFCESMVVGLCKSRAIDVYRSARRRREVNFNDGVSYGSPTVDSALMFADLVGCLPVKYQAVLTLHYFYSYKFHEISLMLGVSEGACKQMRNRGVRLLAGKYGVNLD
jgi:hypothetical protein